MDTFRIAFHFFKQRNKGIFFGKNISFAKNVGLKLIRQAQGKLVTISGTLVESKSNQILHFNIFSTSSVPKKSG